MRTRYQNLRSSTALVRPAPGSGLPGQFYVNMVDRIIGFFNDAGQPIDFAYLPLVGGSLTGFLTLHAAPTANLHAATKGYVDTSLAGLDTDLSNDLVAAIATRLPLAGGQMTGQIKSVGFPVAPEDLGSKGYIDTQVATRLTQAQADTRFLQLSGGSLTNFLTLHANPTAALHAATKGYTDTQVATRLTQTQADARFLQLAGGTLTGALTLPGAPTQDLHAATKKYVDDMVSGIEFPPGTHVGSTPPLAPEQGQLWYKTVAPVGLFIWYVDADSSQWVQIGGGGGQVTDGTPIGAVSFFAAPNPPPGWLTCNNQRVTAAYPELRQYLLDAGSPYGTTGGDPRVPELRGEFIRGHVGGRTGVDDGRVFGSSQGDAIRNIVGDFSYSTSTGASPRTGAVLTGPFTVGVNRTNGPGGNSGITGADLRFDASLQVPTAAENRPRNVSLLPCIKAFDTLRVEGSAEFNIAEDAQVIAGTSTDTLLTPANVRALSGVQTIEATGRTQLMFDRVPVEANEFDLLLGINYPANATPTFDFAGAPLATCNWTRQLNAAAYAAPTGEAAVAAMQIDTDTQARALTGSIRFVRDLIGGTWRAHGNYRRNSTSFIVFHGSFFMNGELVALPRLNCLQGGGFAGGNASVRWRI